MLVGENDRLIGSLAKGTSGSLEFDELKLEKLLDLGLAPGVFGKKFARGIGAAAALAGSLEYVAPSFASSFVPPSVPLNFTASPGPTLTEALRVALDLAGIVALLLKPNPGPGPIPAGCPSGCC